jgi:hypothetical protein
VATPGNGAARPELTGRGHEAIAIRLPAEDDRAGWSVYASVVVLDFQRRVARARLRLAIDEIDGGHMVAMSRPAELADRLETYRRAPRREAPAPARGRYPRHLVTGASRYWTEQARLQET